MWPPESYTITDGEHFRRGTASRQQKAASSSRLRSQIRLTYRRSPDTHTHTHTHTPTRPTHTRPQTDLHVYIPIHIQSYTPSCRGQCRLYSEPIAALEPIGETLRRHIRHGDHTGPPRAPDGSPPLSQVSRGKSVADVCARATGPSAYRAGETG